MDSSTYEPPDLATVLRTLAAYAPPKASQAPTPAPTNPSPFRVEELEEGEYEPPDIEPQLGHQSQVPPSTTTLSTNPWNTSNAKPQSPNIAAPPKPQRQPPIDPATIIDWSTGLKCVMRTVAQSEAIMARIRKMIKTQHEHEKSWWAGRQELLEKQASRASRKRDLDSLLRSVGGNVPSSAPITTPTQDTAELLRYDTQVHRASRALVEAYTTEFKAMGIPFFGVLAGLVDDSSTILNNDATTTTTYNKNDYNATTNDHHSKATHNDNGNDRGDSKANHRDDGVGDVDGKERDKKEKNKRINKDELARLQRKMVETLEDLSRE